jgi:hypothetical protein
MDSSTYKSQIQILELQKDISEKQLEENQFMLLILNAQKKYLNYINNKNKKVILV